MLRRSVALIAAAGITFTACSSSDDRVSSQDSESAEVDRADEVADVEAAPADSTASSSTVSSSTATSSTGNDATAADDGAVQAEPAALQQNGPIAVDGATLAPFESTNDDPAVGAAAPVVTGQSFDGSEIVIGAPTANPTMIVFLAHWCPHCNDEVPVLLGLEESGDLPEGLDVIGVSTAVAADRPNYPPSQWIVDKGWQWPTMADDEDLAAINAFGGTGFPFTVVLDTDGTVLARRSGEASASDTTAFLDAALADATA